jgi:hypothetical protein
MNKRTLVITSIIIAIILVMIGAWLHTKDISYGKYFNEEGKFLGTCTVDTRAVNRGIGTTYVNYFSSPHTYLGYCSSYGGPGSSGGNKTVLQCDDELTKNNLTKQVPGNGTTDTQLILITVPKYDCVVK